MDWRGNGTTVIDSSRNLTNMVQSLRARLQVVAMSNMVAQKYAAPVYENCNGYKQLRLHNTITFDGGGLASIKMTLEVHRKCCSQCNSRYSCKSLSRYFDYVSKWFLYNCYSKSYLEQQRRFCSTSKNKSCKLCKLNLRSIPT